MSTTTLDTFAPPFRPRQAWTAFKALVADKEDSARAFEVVRALSGKAVLKGYARLLKSPGGGEIAYLREELVERLSDRAFIAGFAQGSVGGAYRAFMDAENLSADGLAADSREASPGIDEPHVYAWWSRRLRDLHDVWHVLTGYGRDGFGEVCLAAFSFAQSRNPGVGFLAVAAAFEAQKRHPKAPILRAAFQAWRAGRRAAFLPAEDVGRLFGEPLDAARRRLRIAEPALYLAWRDRVSSCGASPTAP